MIYACAPLGLTIDLCRNNPSFLVIENPKCKRFVVEDFWRQSCGGEGEGILSEDGNTVAINKSVEVIINPFAIDFNSLKIRKHLLSETKEIIIDSVFQDYLAIRTELEAFFEKVLMMLPYSVSVQNNFDIGSLLKYADVHIVAEEMSMPERMAAYLKLIQQLCDVRCVVFIDSFDYLECDEWEEIIKAASYADLRLLFIESKECSFTNIHRTTIIDKVL